MTVGSRGGYKDFETCQNTIQSHSVQRSLLKCLLPFVGFVYFCILEILIPFLFLFPDVSNLLLGTDGTRYEAKFLGDHGKMVPWLIDHYMGCGLNPTALVCFFSASFVEGLRWVNNIVSEL